MSTKNPPKKVPKNQKFKLTKARFIIICCIVLLAALMLLIKVTFWQHYRMVEQAADAVQIRELIIRAADGLKANAPVEAKTGDIYFPQARLYVPAPDHPVQLTYAYDASTPEAVLSVSDRAVFNAMTAQLYGAPNVTAVFDKVPELQACQRGIDVSYKNTPSEKSKVLKATVPLANGKTVYLFAEDACPQLATTVTLLKGLQAY